MSDIRLPPRWQRRVFRFALAGCIVSLILSAGLAIFYHVNASKNVDEAKEEARTNAAAIVEKVEIDLNKIKPFVQTTVDTLAEELSEGRHTEESLNQRLKEVFDENSDKRILEVGVAWEKKHSPAGPGLQHAPHYGLIRGQAQPFNLREEYPADKPYSDHDWFRETKLTGPHWIEPYFGSATEKMTAGYASPFQTSAGNGEFAGVVRINFDLEKLGALIEEMSISESAADTSGTVTELHSSYVFLLSERRKIITHPIDNYLGKEIGDLSKEDGVLRALEARLAEQPDGSMASRLQDPVTDSVTGESYWVFAQQIGSLAWTAAVVINRKETRESERSIAFYQRSITVTTVAFSCFLLLLVLRAYRGSEKALWLFSILVSFIFLAGIVTTWILSVTGEARIDEGVERVVDDASAAAVIDHYLNASVSDPDKVIRVPTGVFVQSLRFTGANNVLLTGYIWQRKSGEALGLDTLPGIILPEAEEISIDDPIQTDGMTRWYFTATLRQQFNYNKYPFDREDAWIRLWPDSFEREFILVPDFKGYTQLRPDQNPGLEKNFVLEGWRKVNSYFSYQVNPYNVRFGQPGSEAGEALELYFNIGLRRNFIGPFVADIVPLVVIAFLVFAVLMIATRQESKIDLVGFSTSAVLGYCAALFFVAIVSHVHLRETLASQGIIYMDYFYFAMYFAILWVSTDSLLFSSSRNIPIIHFQDNLIVKLIYWPVLLGSLFAVTLLVFW